MPHVPAILVSPGQDEPDVPAAAVEKFRRATHRIKPSHYAAPAPTRATGQSDGLRRGRVVLISPHLEDGDPPSQALLRGLMCFAAKVPMPPPLNTRKALLDRGQWLRTFNPFYADHECSPDHGLRQVLKIRQEAMHLSADDTATATTSKPQKKPIAQTAMTLTWPRRGASSVSPGGRRRRIQGWS